MEEAIKNRLPLEEIKRIAGKKKANKK